METDRLVVINKIDELTRINECLQVLGEKWSLAPKSLYNLNLALEEFFSNIVFYAFEDSGLHEIFLNFRCFKKTIEIEIIDDGKAFNPLETSAKDEIDRPLEERKIGGLGIHISKNIINEISYKRIENNNILTLKLNY